eukprot:4706930-Alexandrium_andersonii.AAC.1
MVPVGVPAVGGLAGGGGAGAPASLGWHGAPAGSLQQSTVGMTRRRHGQQVSELVTGSPSLRCPPAWPGPWHSVTLAARQ